MTQAGDRAVIGAWDIELGRVVRETWVTWAKEQPDPKPSWLVGWDELDEGQREVDIRIGRAVAERCAEKRYPGRGEDYMSAGPCEACGSDLDDEGWCEWCQPSLTESPLPTRQTPGKVPCGLRFVTARNGAGTRKRPPSPGQAGGLHVGVSG